MRTYYVHIGGPRTWKRLVKALGQHERIVLTPEQITYPCSAQIQDNQVYGWGTAGTKLKLKDALKLKEEQ